MISFSCQHLPHRVRFFRLACSSKEILQAVLGSRNSCTRKTHVIQNIMKYYLDLKVQNFCMFFRWLSERRELA